MKKIAGVLAALAAALLVASALGASTETYKLSAKLTPGGETPKAKALPGATGRFTGTLTETSAKKTIVWKLVYSKLSGPGLQAHIHKGKPGSSGPVIVSLCGPCHSGQSGRAVVTEAVVKAIESHNTYVNVHTAKNPGGEVRGVLSESAG
jgi:hypothetical protein